MLIRRAGKQSNRYLISLLHLQYLVQCFTYFQLSYDFCRDLDHTRFHNKGAVHWMLKRCKYINKFVNRQGFCKRRSAHYAVNIATHFATRSFFLPC